MAIKDTYPGPGRSAQWFGALAALAEHYSLGLSIDTGGSDSSSGWSGALH